MNRTSKPIFHVKHPNTSYSNSFANYFQELLDQQVIFIFQLIKF